MSNSFKVTVLDTTYAVSSPEREEYVARIAKEVDSVMRQILDGDKRMSPMVAAVFAALQFCDDKAKAQGSADHLRGQIKNYLEEMGKLRAEAEDARKDVARLSLEAGQLKAKLSRMEENN